MRTFLRGQIPCFQQRANQALDLAQHDTASLLDPPSIPWPQP